MSNNFHIVVSNEEFERMIPTKNHVIIKLENPFKDKKLLFTVNESKDPIIPDRGYVFRTSGVESDSVLKVDSLVVFEKYVGVKISVVGSDDKYLLIHNKHIKMQILN